jgi:hypothetical protein
MTRGALALVSVASVNATLAALLAEPPAVAAPGPQPGAAASLPVALVMASRAGFRLAVIRPGRPWSPPAPHAAAPDRDARDARK